MLAQAEARSAGKTEVCTDDLLLGLISEDQKSPNGFADTGLTLEAARAARAKVFDDASMNGQNGGASSKTEMPFSMASKKVFEGAMEASRALGMNYVGPEHIILSLAEEPSGERARAVLAAAEVDLEEVKEYTALKLTDEVEQAKGTGAAQSGTRKGKRHQAGEGRRRR